MKKIKLVGAKPKTDLELLVSKMTNEQVFSFYGYLKKQAEMRLSRLGEETKEMSMVQMIKLLMIMNPKGK